MLVETWAKTDKIVELTVSEQKAWHDMVCFT